MQSIKILMLVFSVVLASCVSVESPQSPPVSSNHEINVIKQIPKITPKASARFEDTQLIFVSADQASAFAASLLVPVPFVTDAIIDASNKGKATQYEEKYREISAYDITLETLADFKTLTSGTNGFDLYPLVFIEECFDGVYRISLAYQVQQNDWMGRYYYHLPTTIPKKDIGEPSQDELAHIRRDLQAGAKKLFSMVSRDLSGELRGEDKKATVGSLYIVGSKLSGLTSPTIFHFKHSDILEETDNSLIVKISGDPKGDAKSGGLAYGVHFFTRDQLHTFEMDSTEE